MSKKTMHKKSLLPKEDFPLVPTHRLASPFDVAARMPDAEIWLALFSSLDHPMARLAATKMREAIRRRHGQASCGRRATTDERAGHDRA